MLVTGRTQMLSRFSLSESLIKMKEIGFDGAEISLLNQKFDFRPDLLEKYVIDYNRNLLSELGLVAGSVSYHGNYIYDDQIYENVKLSLSRAKGYGVDVFIIAGTSKVSADLEEWKRSVSRIREFTALAENNGLKLAIEFEPGFIVGNTNELVKLFGEIDSDSLGCNLDLGHVFLCDEHPMDSVKLLGKKIFHVHVENMRRGVHNHLVPEVGDMDLSLYINALKSTGFNGAMALDIYNYDYLKVSPGAVHFIKGLLSGS